MFLCGVCGRVGRYTTQTPPSHPPPPKWAALSQQVGVGINTHPHQLGATRIESNIHITSVYIYAMLSIEWYDTGLSTKTETRN